MQIETIPAQKSRSTTALALKEWGAVAHALLQGRQTVLLRKGGIHEKSFNVREDRFVVFPTVAHSHDERVRPEHKDLLALGSVDAQVRSGKPGGESYALTVRVGIELFDVIQVERPENLDQIERLHIWTTASVMAERVDFRPRHRLQALVVRAFALPQPVEVPRLAEYGGCTSWVYLPVDWPRGVGTRCATDERLAEDSTFIHQAIGAKNSPPLTAR